MQLCKHNMYLIFANGNSQLQSHTNIAEEIIALDTLSISAKTLSILLDSSRRSFVEKSEQISQMMLDLCQEVCLSIRYCTVCVTSLQLLDSSHIEDARPVLMKEIYTLTKRTRLYPACLLLEDITSKSGFPITSGSFGDIWEGYLKGNRVAIKVMRLKNDEHNDSCRKVCLHLHITRTIILIFSFRLS